MQASLLRHLVRAVIAAHLLAVPNLRSQCTYTGLPGSGLPGVGYGYGSEVRSMVRWDPDGAGPLPERIVAAGTYLFVAGTITVRDIVAFDPTNGSWDDLGGGVSSTIVQASVEALAVLPNGDLIAAGRFQRAGTTPASNIARWDGSQWHALGTGTDNTVRALAVLPGGDLVAAGSFGVAGGTTVTGLARWDGSSWSAIPGLANAGVYALDVAANGDLVAAGSLSIQASAQLSQVALWNGTAWTSIADQTSTPARSVAVLPGGDIVASGSWLTINGVAASNIARWDGTTWNPVGSGLDRYAQALDVAANGDLVATGTITTAGGLPAGGLARWSPTAGWSTMGAGIPLGGQNRTTCAISDANGDTIVGGYFVEIDGVPASRIARWDGTSWSPLVPGTDGGVTEIEPLDDGSFVIAGEFLTLEGVNSRRIARWDDGAVTGFGSGADGYVTDVRPDPTTGSAAFLVAGEFTRIDGVATGSLALWDGIVWQSLAAPLQNTNAVARHSSGDLFAAGLGLGPAFTPQVVQRTGTAWTAIGTIGGNVDAIVELPGGDVIVAGEFTTIGGVTAARVARWDGTTWSAMGTGFQAQVSTLHIAADGTLYAAGQFAEHVARWNGTSWQSVGGGTNSVVTALRDAPNGDLLAFGSFNAAGAIAADKVARWDGQSWSPISPIAPGEVLDGAVTDSGLLLGGRLLPYGPMLGVGLLELANSCAPAATSLATGCAGSGTPNTLTAIELAWVGGTYRAIAQGLPAQALVVDVFGLATTAPTLLPQAAAGCTLVVRPDLPILGIATNGAATSSLAIPNVPALTGADFHHQVACFAIGPQQQIVEVTTSDALTLTIGAL